MDGIVTTSKRNPELKNVSDNITRYWNSYGNEGYPIGGTKTDGTRNANLTITCPLYCNLNWEPMP